MASWASSKHMSSVSHRFRHVKCRISNICCCILLAATVEKIKTNIRNSTFNAIKLMTCRGQKSQFSSISKASKHYSSWKSFFNTPIGPAYETRSFHAAVLYLITHGPLLWTEVYSGHSALCGLALAILLL